MSKSIRIGAWALVLAMAFAGATAGVVAAETLFTKGRTAIRARPGEQARIVVRVDAGEAVQVVEREGRWIKVEHQGQVGWVTRTSVRAGQDRADRQRPRQPRRERPRQREARGEQDEPRSGFGRRAEEDDAMRQVVTSERARLFAEPRREAEVVAVVRRGDDLRVLGQRGPFFRVRGPDGEEGWISSSAVSDPEVMEGARESREGQGEESPRPARSARAEKEAPEDEEKEDEEVAEPAVAEPRVTAEREPELRIGVGVGATAVSLDYADLDATSSGFASGLALSGEASFPLGGGLSVGADIRYLAQMGLAGLSYEAAGAELEGSNFLVYDLDVGGRAGYAISESLAAYLRLGFAYQSLYTRDLENEARMPREELAGLTAGLGFETEIGQAISAELVANALVAGTHRQTTGLEDGAELDGITALWGALGIRYALAENRGVELRYRFGRHVADWSGASARTPDQADTSRTDLTHQLSLGYTLSF